MCMGEAGLLKIVVYGIIVCMHTMVKTPFDSWTYKVWCTLCIIIPVLNSLGKWPKFVIWEVA
jgi:Na+-translocating ferredoxin:NAD+ oxidoreductase RnfE subunit